MVRRLLAPLLLGLLVGCAGGESPPDLPTISQASQPSTTSTPPSTSSTSSTSGTEATTAMTPTTGLPDAPRRVTPDDSGSTFTLRLGATTSLVLRDPAAPEPQAEGSSVLLIPTVNVQDSGVREWELRAVSPGTTVIRGGSTYEITFVVP